MDVQFRFRGLEPSLYLKEHARRRLEFQLAPFSHEVRSVYVTLTDVNGPKGGLDMKCLVTVRSRHLATIAVEELAADAYAAIDVAIARAARAVARRLGRRHDQARRAAGGYRAASSGFDLPVS
ncbi:MAG: HPF/RaiA family ribosome-associated protein [Myxococcaceae bacterium]|nr:HPF/RaiA family ribosome-associated protein [Myxococcaceae bacterium]